MDRIIAMSLVWFASMLAAGTVLADEVKVFRSEETGAIRLEAKAETWVDTGYTVTTEAQKYPEAVKQLIAEKLATVPAEKEVINTHLVGLLAWERESRVKTVVARDGEKIILRSTTEAETVAVIEKFNNHFAIYVGVALVLLIIGNLLIKKSGNVATAATATATATATAFAAAFAFAAATTAATTAAAVAFLTGKDRLWYQIFSAMASACLILSVVTAVY